MFDLKQDFDSGFEIPAREYRERVERVQRELAARNIDVAYAIGTPFVPGDVQYLSGYDTQCPENCSVSVLSPTRAYLCVGPEGEVYARQSMRHGEIAVLRDLTLAFEDYPNARLRGLGEVLREAAGGSIQRVGRLTFDTFIPVSVERSVRDGASSRCELVEATDILYEMRWIKSEAELRLMRTAFKICTEASRKVAEAVKPGVRELELAAIADYVHKSMGCSSFCFDQIVISGERTNAIVGRPTERKLERGDPVTFFINGRYKGYTAHMGRTLVAGGMSKEQAAYYEHGYRAMEICKENFSLGLPGKGIDAAATTYYRSVGLDQYKVYSFSHGAGLHESNEGKASDPRADWLIPRNIVMMLNVGLYNHPRFHGYGLEDGAIINGEGRTEVLTDLPLRL